MKLVVALTFPVHPPLGGGQVRVYHLYRELARSFEVELVSLAPPGTPAGRRQLAPGLWETRVPRSAAQAAEELALEREVGTVVSDVATYRLYRLNPEYLAALEAAAEDATAVVASHPYTVGAIREATSAPLCYEAHNVEVALKADVFDARNAAARRLLEDVRESERICCEEAELVWTCSEADRAELMARYDIAEGRLVVAPNGAAVEDLEFRLPSVRREYKRRLRLQDRFLALFIASWHQPNIAGAERLLEVADERPDVDFLFVGSVGQALEGKALSANVQVMGAVSAELKQAVLSVADVALNPVNSGSGTNIKMLDYFGSGVPVISTGFGARGLGVEPGEHFLEADPLEFGAALDLTRGLDIDQLDSLAQAARRHVEAELSWSGIAQHLTAALERTLTVDPGEDAASAEASTGAL